MDKLQILQLRTRLVRLASEAMALAADLTPPTRRHLTSVPLPLKIGPPALAQAGKPQAGKPYTGPGPTRSPGPLAKLATKTGKRRPGGGRKKDPGSRWQRAQALFRGGATLAEVCAATGLNPRSAYQARWHLQRDGK